MIYETWFNSDIYLYKNSKGDFNLHIAYYRQYPSIGWLYKIFVFLFLKTRTIFWLRLYKKLHKKLKSQYAGNDYVFKADEYKDLIILLVKLHLDGLKFDLRKLIDKIENNN